MALVVQWVVGHDDSTLIVVYVKLEKYTKNMNHRSYWIDIQEINVIPKNIYVIFNKSCENYISWMIAIFNKVCEHNISWIIHMIVEGKEHELKETLYHIGEMKFVA